MTASGDGYCHCHDHGIVTGSDAIAVSLIANLPLARPQSQKYTQSRTEQVFFWGPQPAVFLGMSLTPG